MLVQRRNCVHMVGGCALHFYRDCLEFLAQQTDLVSSVRKKTAVIFLCVSNRIALNFRLVEGSMGHRHHKLSISLNKLPQRVCLLGLTKRFRQSSFR